MRRNIYGQFCNETQLGIAYSLQSLLFQFLVRLCPTVLILNFLSNFFPTRIECHLASFWSYKLHLELSKNPCFTAEWKCLQLWSQAWEIMDKGKYSVNLNRCTFECVFLYIISIILSCGWLKVAYFISATVVQKAEIIIVGRGIVAMFFLCSGDLYHSIWNLILIYYLQPWDLVAWNIRKRRKYSTLETLF